MAFCPKCGMQMPEGVKFCPNCGNNVAQAQQPVNQQPLASQPVTPAVTAAPAPVVPEVPVAPVTPVAPVAAAPMSPKKKGSKGKLIGIVIGLVLCMALGGIGGWFLFGDHDSDDDDDEDKDRKTRKEQTKETDEEEESDEESAEFLVSAEIPSVEESESEEESSEEIPVVESSEEPEPVVVDPIPAIPVVEDDPSVTTINVWAFSNEVPQIMEEYVRRHPDFKYNINCTIIPSTDGNYQNSLDEALRAGGDYAPDIYCAEAAFVLKYTQGDASAYAAAYKDLGLDVDRMIRESEIAQYSVDVGTRWDGSVVGLGYQSNGGAFIYRRSIARDVWGTDDPAVIGNKIGGGSGEWNQFWMAASELKARGYAIISGTGDIWHPIEASADAGWVVNGRLNIDPKRESFMDYAKLLVDNGWTNNTQDWAQSWYDDMAGAGYQQVFGFFGPAWLINYVIANNCGDTYGDWAVCESPVGFFWGGTWILANKETKVKNAVADIISWITLESDSDSLQYAWANATIDWDGDPYSVTLKDAVSSNVVMERSNGSIDFLGGQNMFDVFIPANAYANGKVMNQYDEYINNLWRDQVRAYVNGEKSREQAIEDFKLQVEYTFNITAN